MEAASDKQQRWFLFLLLFRFWQQDNAAQYAGRYTNTRSRQWARQIVFPARDNRDRLMDETYSTAPSVQHSLNYAIHPLHSSHTPLIQRNRATVQLPARLPCTSLHAIHQVLYKHQSPIQER